MLPIGGATEQHFSPTENGHYAVNIINGLCEVTSDCIEVIVINNESAWMESIHVYPNPIHGNFTVDMGSIFERTTLKLYNSIGQKVFEQNFEQQQIYQVQVDVSPGVYTLKLDVGNGQIGIYKLVKI